MNAYNPSTVVILEDMRNVCELTPDYTTQKSRGHQFSIVVLWVWT